MFRFLCLWAFILPLMLSAQPLNNITRKSHQTLAFKVTMAQVDKFISKKNIDVDVFAQQKPFKILQHFYDYEDSLPIGFYVLLSVKDSMLDADVVCVSNIIAYPVNNQKRVQLEVRDESENFISNATVISNNKICRFNEQAKNYVVPQKKPDNALIKIYTPQDSLFFYLKENEDEWRQPKPIFTQKWNRFKLTKTYKIVSWIPQKIQSLFSKKHHHYKPYKSAGTRGLMVFNQPKYKLGDTVKLKAYLFNKKNKPYKNSADVYLEYWAPGKGSKSQFLTELKPTDNNSFIYEFILRDTLVNDINYTVIFKNKDKRRLLQNNFRAEDYVLDEVAKYSLRSEKEEYFKNDTLKFYAEAKDANGLPLLDGTAKLILTTSNIDTFYKKELQIPDTLYTEEKKLATEGDTKFLLPASLLPNADLAINAQLIFKNSNNEIQEKDENIHYNYYSKKIIVKQINDTIYADAIENGKSITASGSVDLDGSFKKTLKINYPFKIKIDPLIEEYDFYWEEKDSIIQSKDFELSNYYTVSLSQTSNGDTLGFVLYNPNKIPVNYSIFKNNRLLETEKDSVAEIKWQKQTSNIKQMLTVKWQYRWKGKEQSNSQNIALLYKKMNLNVQQSTYVFPGQKDNIEITATDYKNKPVSNVNITALSYNSQFKEKNNVPDPPYLQRYHVKPQLLYKKYEVSDEDKISHSYSLGNHRAFIKKFGLDTMTYYKILFPADTINDFSTPVEDYIPQIAIHVVKNGVPQQIFILTINNRMAYYYNTTVTSPYSFFALHGYNKIGIRLSDKYIEIDSLYVQPFYKHDFVFDLDKLPVHAKVLPQEKFLSDAEKSQLENSLFQLKYNYQTSTVNSYLWQTGRLDSIPATYQDQILGPFIPYDSIHFYAPNRFDIHFIFEPTYQYTLSDKILRLEKNKIFNDKQKYFLWQEKEFGLKLGDTLKSFPVISYSKQSNNKFRYLQIDPYWMSVRGYDSIPTGKLSLEFKKDTSFTYLLLKSHKADGKQLVRYFNKKPGIIPADNYTLYLVMNDLSTVIIDSINILPNSTLCKKIEAFNFVQNDKFIDSLVNENERKSVIKKQDTIVENLPAYYPKGNGNIFGTVTDAKGKLPIAGASIIIKGTKAGTSSYSNGYFIIKNIKSGKYTLVISSIGYVSKNIEVTVPNNGNAEIKAALEVSSLSLNDVVVIGYGTVRKAYVTGSVAMVKQEEDYDKVLTRVDLPQALQGRVAGVYVTNGEPGANTNVRIRGLSSITGNTPLIVIDGIAYDEMPVNISPEMVESIEVLKDAAATSIYGAKGANGVIVITTKAKTLRQTFRDYAFWKPELMTDENGKVKFEVAYPDNVTSWKNYFLAMDKHARIGKTVSLTQAYKPVMAQLSVPQFLIEGDSSIFIGKMMNYTNDKYNVTDKFSINGIEKINEKNVLTPKASVVTSLPCFAANADTVKATFNLQTETGFKDGEERKIPVFKQGVEESDGDFMILKNDTTINFINNQTSTGFTLSVENKTLDVLLKEIEHLKNYPYACMEQTASKLSGLLMEKQIDEYLHLKFKDEKMLNQLLEKIQKNQMYSGGWSWWEKEKENFYISNYIINALLPLRSDAVVETNIRNGLLYLQNQLPKANSHLLLQALTTMAAAKHLMDYKPFIEKINFDSLSMHEKWQWIFIQQQTKGNYQTQLKQLIDKKQQSMLGGVYWGDENYLWYSNSTASTVLAYKVLQNEPAYSYLLSNIVQHFFEMKRRGYWRNTVESASILNAILPDVLKNENKNMQQPTLLKISGDTSFSVSEFPFVQKFSTNIKNISIQKTGGGYTYLSLYQTWFNQHPNEVTDKFDIKTSFKINGKTQQYIPSGEKIKMIVDVHVKKDAEYAMIEVPVPAGCTYASKNSCEWNAHKEYLKNKVVMFFEYLNAGNYSYEIELESRYAGKYFINPCKAELMYFPIFYGRNGIKNVEIK